MNPIRERNRRELESLTDGQIDDFQFLSRINTIQADEGRKSLINQYSNRSGLVSLMSVTSSADNALFALKKQTESAWRN